MSGSFKGDVEARKGGRSGEEDEEVPSDPFDIIRTKNASLERLKKWREAALRLTDTRSIFIQEKRKLFPIRRRGNRRRGNRRHGNRPNRMYLQVMLEWVFVLTNLVLETLSTIFDQISSPQRPQFALIGMAMSFVAFLICTLELLYRARKERAVWRQCWFYQSDKPLGSFADNFGFICAASQCFTSTIQYVFFESHADNPIKVSFFPVMLALSFLYLQFTKKRQLEA